MPKNKKVLLFSLTVLAVILTFWQLALTDQTNGESLIDDDMFLIDENISLLDGYRSDKEFINIYSYQKVGKPSFKLDLISVSIQYSLASNASLELVCTATDSSGEKVFYRNKLLSSNNSRLVDFEVKDHEFSQLKDIKVYLWNKDKEQITLKDVDLFVYSDLSTHILYDLDKFDLLEGSDVDMSDKLYHTIWLGEIGDSLLGFNALKVGLKGKNKKRIPLYVALEIKSKEGERTYYQTKKIGLHSFDEISFNEFSAYLHDGDHVMLYLWNQRRLSEYILKDVRVKSYR